MSNQIQNPNVKNKYDLADFDSLPEQPEIVESFKWKGRDFHKFGLSVLCGTVLDKNKNKHVVSILTTNGVVNLKLYGGAYSYYDKTISEVQENGKKKVMEKSWFTRGNLVLVVGYRQDNLFIPKRYTNSVYQHSIMLIKEVSDNGELELQTDRINSDNYEIIV